LGIVTPERFKGKEAFYEKMVRLFVKDLPETWAAFDDAVGDMEGTKVFVHKIKGTAGNLDLTEVYQSALQFEGSLRGNEPDKSMYQTLIDACNAVRQSLPA
jgi:HPt (histidine-containing phosphotransfer) domain-containing protein